AQGFEACAMRVSHETVSEHYVEQESAQGHVRNVQQGYEARQSIVLTSGDLGRIEAAYKAIVQFQADGHPVTYSPPLFLVSNLEDVKMSLIGAATENARVRAEQLATHGG